MAIVEKVDCRSKNIYVSIEVFCLGQDLSESARVQFTVLKAFSIAGLDFLPNFVQDLMDSMQLPDIPSPPKFSDNGFGGLFLATAAPNLELLLVIEISILFLYTFSRRYPLFQRIMNALTDSFPIRFLLNIMTNLYIAIAL